MNIRIDYRVTKEDIRVAIIDLMYLDKKVTKKSIAEHIRNWAYFRGLHNEDSEVTSNRLNTIIEDGEYQKYSDYVRKYSI